MTFKASATRTSKNIFMLFVLLAAIFALVIFAYLNKNLQGVIQDFFYSNPLQGEILNKVMTSKELNAALKKKNCSHFSDIIFIPTSDFTKQIVAAPNEFQKILDYNLDEACELKLEIIMFENQQESDKSQKIALNIQYSVKEKSENVLLEESFTINLN